ncbi:hypothetical protein GON03_09730 [Nocardioides sp. MAH-18]|uniref:WxL domain-containing protein n=1 Tax=Nocardioides agri TaxID=2682843 RepID=A0A6L6XRP0_9ACTN|nr:MULTISPECIES: WxL domain-containing protein [unclassified Nocardioides]MBA2954605.1 WxL domain-containing protein [Nocardioides sp. CGMCC 1.13656]MVQ49462.1 hypothetical protein [Nocardioides sp. MAH-18]
MHLRNKRTLSAIAALSATSLGLTGLASSPANALNGINFTVTSNNATSVVIPVDGQGTYFIKHAAVGDVLTFTPASATPFSAIAQAHGAAGLVPPASAAAFANIGGAVLGVFPAGVGQNFTLANYSPAAPLAAFGISGGQANQAIVDAGLAPVVAVADAGTQAQFAVAQLQMGNQNPSQAPTLTATNSSAGGTVTLGGAHFWGAPVTGVGTAAAAAAGIPAPTVLLDGTTPLGAASVQTSAATLNVGTGAFTPGGVPSGTVSLPNNLAGGSHTLTLIQPNVTPYDGNGTGPAANQVVATASFTVAGPTAAASPATAQDGTVVAITGDNWAPNFAASLAFTNGSDTGSATVDASGHLSGTITVNTANEALGSNDVIVTQATSGLTATASLNISSIPTLHQDINEIVLPGSGLGDTQSASTVNLSATTLNGHVQTATGSLNQVTVTDTRGTNAGWTLTGRLAGDFINATPGNENGNTTATGVEPNSHNRIPASNLSWNPAVSLAVPTDGLPGDVAAGSTTALSKTVAKTLAVAGVGGGGGTWQADAALSLTVPAYVNKGTYTATLDLVLG